jgi:hypothetical protein
MDFLVFSKSSAIVMIFVKKPREKLFAANRNRSGLPERRMKTADSE